MKAIKAWIFVRLVRPFLKDGKPGELRDCPVCGELLQFYSDVRWTHMVDGDIDCYGALGAGKGVH